METISIKGGEAMSDVVRVFVNGKPVDKENLCNIPMERWEVKHVIANRESARKQKKGA